MPKRKLRYVPWLISLIGLPILFFFFPVEDPPPDPVVFQFNIPAKDNRTGKILTEQFVRDRIKTKKVSRISLHEEFPRDVNINAFRTSAKFDLIATEMQRLSFFGDTTIALQVEFGPENTYDEWVRIHNISQLCNVRRYTFIDNSLYFFLIQ